MWANMSDSFEFGQMYIMGRNWNMTEHDSHKSYGCSRKLSQVKLTSWYLMKTLLDVQDHFRPSQNLRYSWDNGKARARLLVRLNRFYMSNQGCSQDMVEEYRKRGDCEFLNHLRVGLCVNLGATRKQGSCYKLNSAFLKEPKVREGITKIWKDSPANAHFWVKFRKVIQFCTMHCKEKAKASRDRELRAREELERL
jgi:hypothetical protein